MPIEDLEVLTKSHPALIDSVIRWRGVGGWGATASILRILEVGAISVGLERGCLSLHLVPGVSTPKHSHSNGRCVEHGHIEGLSSFDRKILTMLFDDIAHSSVTDLAQLSSYRRSHPLAFWTHLKEWRDEVDEEARRLRSCGRLSASRDLLYGVRPQLVDGLNDVSLSNRQWSRLAAVALSASLDDVVVKTARQRREGHESHSPGPSSVVWLCSIESGRRSGLDVLRRLFSPLQPSSYAPAQYTKLVLPPYRGRPRFVDDGSLRLGG